MYHLNSFLAKLFIYSIYHARLRNSHNWSEYNLLFYQILLHAPLGRRLRLPMIVLTSPTRSLKAAMPGFAVEIVVAWPILI